MAREFNRRDRVAEELKRELGSLIATQVKDPRVELAAITDVDVSSDLKYAKVYVSTFDVTAADGRGQEVVAGLKAARGFVKRELGKRLHMRVMPELTFIEDTTEREAHRLGQVIDEAVETDRRHAGSSDDTSTDDGTS